MSTIGKCRCCGDPVSAFCQRFDQSIGTPLGFVCLDCAADLDNHLLLTAACLMDGFIEPEPISNRKESIQ